MIDRKTELENESAKAEGALKAEYNRMMKKQQELEGKFKFMTISEQQAAQERAAARARGLLRRAGHGELRRLGHGARALPRPPPVPAQPERDADAHDGRGEQGDRRVHRAQAQRHLARRGGPGCRRRSV